MGPQGTEAGLGFSSNHGSKLPYDLCGLPGSSEKEEKKTPVKITVAFNPLSTDSITGGGYNEVFVLEGQVARSPASPFLEVLAKMSFLLTRVLPVSSFSAVGKGD